MRRGAKIAHAPGALAVMFSIFRRQVEDGGMPSVMPLPANDNIIGTLVVDIVLAVGDHLAVAALRAEENLIHAGRRRVRLERAHIIAADQPARVRAPHTVGNGADPLPGEAIIEYPCVLNAPRPKNAIVLSAILGDLILFYQNLQVRSSQFAIRSEVVKKSDAIAIANTFDRVVAHGELRWRNRRLVPRLSE